MKQFRSDSRDLGVYVILTAPVDHSSIGGNVVAAACHRSGLVEERSSAKLLILDFEQVGLILLRRRLALHMPVFILGVVADV